MADEEKKVEGAEQAEEKKKRRSREEVAAALAEEDEKRMKEAEEAAAAIKSDEKLIEEAKKRIELNKRKVKNNRNRARTSVGMATYSKVVSRLGFYQTEKECNTKSDFEKLQADVLTRIAELIVAENQLKGENPVQATEDEGAETVPAGEDAPEA